MSAFEYLVAALLVCARVFLLAMVIAFVVNEVRKSGRSPKK